MKKAVCALIALMMLAVTGAAMAGTGDQLVRILDSSADFSIGSIRNVVMSGGKLYIFVSGATESLTVFDIASGGSAEYDMQEMTDRMNGLLSDESAEDTAEEGSSGSGYESVNGWFAKDGEVYAIVSRSYTSGEENLVDGGHVRKLVLSEGKADLEAEDTVLLDWSGMIFTSGGWTTSRYVNGVGANGDRVYVGCYDENGNYVIQVFDLTTGETREIAVSDATDFAVQPDGSLLLSTYEWGDEGGVRLICRFNPETEQSEELARFDLNEGDISAVTLNDAQDTIYFVRQGEIYAAPVTNAAEAQAVNDCILNNAQTFATWIGDGRLMIWGENGVILRNTDPALRSETSIRIRPYAWTDGLNSALYAFSAEHGDITVVREDYGDPSDLLQAMMNRDDRVDLYLMDLDSSAFNAVFDRGFLADLSGNSVLTETVEKMYPYVKDAVMKDGKLLAVPLEVSGTGLGYNAETLEKMGLTEADLPTTWDQFFDFLENTAELVQEKDVRLVDFYTEREGFQRDLLVGMLTQYSLTRDGEPMNNETIRNLLDRMRGLDYDRLGIPTAEELEEIYNSDGVDAYYDKAASQPVLFNTYASYTVTSYTDNLIPLRLALSEGENAVLPVSLKVAFVNPYSKHIPEAEAFLETLAANMTAVSRRTLDPEMNEPVRYADHEEMRRSLEQWRDAAKKNMESAQDEESREGWAELLELYEKELVDYDETNWLVSPLTIERYRNWAGSLQVVRWNYFNALTSMEGSEQYWELQDSFLRGQAPSAELLSFIDKKVQMMRLEGN